MTLCGPWLDLDDVRICKPQDFGDGIYAKALLAASDMLYHVTRYRWPGLCTDILRPCAGCAGTQYLAYPNGGSRPVGPSWNWGWPCGCTDQIVCGGSTHSVITLPGYPIVDIPEILIDGVAFTEFKIANDRSLLRTDGQPWPVTQDLTKDATEVGTFQIIERYGAVPGPAGLIAAERLACELAKSWTPDCDCAISPRVTQLVHEGETITLANLNDAMVDGKFGLKEVDWWITSVNGDQPASDPGARVLSAADMHRTQRVR